MKNYSLFYLNSIVFFLIILWVYAALSKLLDFRHFVWEMENQEIYSLLTAILIWTLPVTEIVVAVMLSIEKSRFMGLEISFVLLLIFSTYIGLVVGHFFKKVPCSCGGILEHMGWMTHFFFNVICLALNLIAILIIKRKEQVTLNKR